MWNSKIVAWLEQKLIALTSALYVKRREAVTAVVEQVAPTLEPTKKRTFVKRTEPKITKAATVAKKTKAIAKPAVKKATAKKPAVKKAAPKKPAAAVKAKPKAK
jgi:hypothetical protein